jgi:GT2 family glycosyltransferase
VLNGEETIKECLVSLLQSSYPSERSEILVVDNGSTDRTAEIVRAYPVTLLREERRGASYARNRGVEAAEGEILAFTDADCSVSSGWLRELVQGFDDESVGGVEGETLAYPPVTPIERYQARIGSHRRRVRAFSIFAPFVPTANVAFRRDVFNRIGLFDTRFPAAGGEDIDFSWRFIEETGFKLFYAPKAVVLHRHSSTVRGFFSKYTRYGRAQTILRAKYPGRLEWGWREEIRAWADAARFAGLSVKASFQYGLRGGPRTTVEDAYFTFLRKLAVRVGFLRGTIAGGER